jgi:nitrate/TMAO reductase-like tetraheme cytochrome c subunit
METVSAYAADSPAAVCELFQMNCAREKESPMGKKLQVAARRYLFSLIILASFNAVASAEVITFPQGSATPSETCGACHNAIYREYTLGIGSDLHGTSTPASQRRPEGVPANASSTATAHASSGFHTKELDGKMVGNCNVCHFPDSFNISESDATGKAGAAKGMAMKGGLTCAGCHLTPDGAIRGPRQERAPHRIVADPELQSSALCGHCHGSHGQGKRVIGKMFQTFLEWQEDYNQAGLGKQQCQDCHMPRVMRQGAEGFDLPSRAVGRHLWAGAHSKQRHQNSLSLTIVQPAEGKKRIDLHVSNIGAGHSVPTGAPARAVFLRVEVLDKKGGSKARKEWMFAPSYGDRPDDKAFLEQDKKMPNGEAAARADVQGPHESSLRAGEERVLPWEPSLAPGEYTVKAALVYTVDRFRPDPAAGDQGECGEAVLDIITR